MGLITGLVLIVCGVLAAASLIAKRQPNSQQFIDKLVPYQGWIGFVVCLWGAWIIISSVLHLNLLHIVPIWWATFLATGLLEFGLGFLLGFGLLTKYLLSKNETALAKGQELRAKLATVQIPMGLAGIGLGVWCLVASLLIYHY